MQDDIKRPKFTNYVVITLRNNPVIRSQEYKQLVRQVAHSTVKLVPNTHLCEASMSIGYI